MTPPACAVRCSRHGPSVRAESAGKRGKGSPQTPTAERSRVVAAIAAEAARLGHPGAGRGGKAVKQIKGQRDRFLRLRVGPRRVIYRVDHAARTMRVLRVIDRRDSERWLRDR